MKQKLLSVAKRLIETRIYLGCSCLLDHAAVFSRRIRGTSTRRDTAPRSYNILIPTLGKGNIGDQAMVEAFLGNVPGHIVCIMDRRENLLIPPEHRHRTTVIEAPGLVGGTPIGRIRARVLFCALMANAKSVNVIGADVMDGGYSRRESILRSQLLWMAAKLGVPGQVLGFSWNGSSHRLTRKYLEKSASSTLFNLRDPLSLDRFNMAGYPKVRLVSDMAFTLSTSTADPELKTWVDSRKAEGRKIAIFNTSGLIDKTQMLDSDYSSIAEHLLANNFAIIVLPHVRRQGDDDTVPARRLSRDYRHEDLLLVDRQLTPGNVVSLAATADVCITGRMHLAILSLGQETPAIALATQGKVEGMLAMFGLQHYAVLPVPGLASQVIELLDELWTKEQETKLSIHQALPKIRLLSALNYELAVAP